MFGKVDLPPALGAAQLPDSLAQSHADIRCHSAMIGLAFPLYLAHTLFGAAVKGKPIMPLHGKIASALKRTAGLCVFILAVMLSAVAKDDWQSDLRKWAESSQTDPSCKVRYTVGVYRPDMGDKPAWGLMTEKMFKWFSRDGAKLAPSICPVSRATKDQAEYRILFSVSPMKTVSQTSHGSEVQTTSEPFNASVTSQTTYSDGGTANGRATITGEQTSTVVFPTETTISKSSVAEYMYTYRVSGEQLELIASDSVVFSRVAASGSGNNAAGAEIGAGIGNLIRASGDRHRADKLYEEALKAIRADAQENAAKLDALPENHASENARTDTHGTSAAVAPIAAPVATAQSVSSADDITTLKGMAATGYPDAQYILAADYLTGHGVPQDYAQAAIWYSKAAEQGFAEAESALGMLYHVGHGVRQDDAHAVQWLRKAAEQNIADAQFYLGGAYFDGQGVPQDYAQAALWQRRAAEQGHAVAQYYLGRAYYDGQGVPQDYAEAYFWFDLAAAGKLDTVNDEGAHKGRAAAATYLTPADLSRVQERARKWFEDHPAKP